MVKFKLGRILTLSIQILTRFFLTYISSTLQDYTSASFYIIWFLAFLNIFFFLLACLKNPGYLPKPSVKHSKQESLSNSHMDFTISRYHNEYEDQSCNESDRPHINIEELPDQIYTLNENRRFQSSSPVPQKEISQSSESDEIAPVVHDQLSVSNIQSQKFELTTANPKVSISDSPEVYFCKACTMVQPPRAHHCKECDKCVALFDHHCPWIGNCIGEKNKLVFYFMILGLCLEGWIGFYMVINAVEMKKEWVTIAQLICAAGLVGMNSYLSIFFLIHSALILLNVTTYEVISWEQIYYLNDKSICSSPFYKGLRSSLRVLCDHSNKITDWNI